MPQFDSFQQPDTSAQATFVVALIGLGILVLALLVLGGVLLRRWSRRKARKAQDLDLDFGGVQPGGTGVSSSLALAAMTQPEETVGTVVLDVEPAEPRAEEEPRRKQRAPGVRTKEDRKRLERRMMQIEDGVDEDEVDDGELGANAGVLEGRGTSASMQFKQGRGGSKLVMGGGKIAGSRASDRPGSGSSGSGSDAGRGSPADELYRSRLTARQVPGSPGGSRVPTPPEASQGPRGQAPRRKPGSRGSDVGGEDIEFSIKHRPATASSSGSAGEWEDNTGIRIDDILQQARSAAAIAAHGKGTPDRSRAWKPGDRSPAPSSSSGEAAAAKNGGATKDRVPSSSSSSGSRDLSTLAKPTEPVPPPPKAPAGADGRPARPPVMAPLMAARLGIKPQQAIGGRTMAAIGSKNPLSPGKMEPPPAAATTRAVMLTTVTQQQRQNADLPVAGQAGVPLPPPRGSAAMPPSRNIGGLNGNGRSSASPPQEEASPPAPGQAAWRTPTNSAHGTRPPLGAVGARGGAGANGRDGRGMARLGGRRGASEEHVLEEDDS